MIAGGGTPLRPSFTCSASCASYPRIFVPPTPDLCPPSVIVLLLLLVCIVLLIHPGTLYTPPRNFVYPTPELCIPHPGTLYTRPFLADTPRSQ